MNVNRKNLNGGESNVSKKITLCMLVRPNFFGRCLHEQEETPRYGTNYLRTYVYHPPVTSLKLRLALNIQWQYLFEARNGPLYY